ncbi:UDP-N-acetylmuramate dehydrogenase [Fusobacterium mortiferum]|jgi:UDP-N-acetylmuramate dehydrogenase|uniref:UDP-N-acetylenolpyruvoylglucosamine reductase n=2 Tax=Fusobacterium mortiferum TaxID=850 RepID=A0A414PPZ1_FUSMR|nr:UDP-N-acetylmuramate dehydrogenase [Fusobacterium mortiferum]AVQ18026.1 UDP-N-acetylmuramate dehydrogenase [Fusobacterium mortiferum ATCC 9817]EEO36733.1 UDP-N-acetylmuramate dehydrogenase [Fusobacterium mortiferum ATCC 9817]MCF2700165.1 UDP-N-acetylmuramate dehydrogenase [Fusobacterium mortiferum]MCI7666474.1 UDP-N-acetylmuramate dehydrogenase [Fusobacterium mortiferum]MDD7261799.1 UDP-N-acetylmuramate dehydrogenase [Fusobacterium mortiferum]
MRILENHSMKNHSNMKVGGVAKRFIVVENKEELKDIFEKYRNIFLIGNGTNTLIDEGDLDITFVSLKELNKIEELGEGIVRVEAGLDFNKLIAFMNRNNYSGLENLAGIPGSVGGLVYMNGGAYGSEIFDCIKEVEIFDENHQIRTLKKEDIKFSYRSTEIQDKKWVIISATFEFKRGFDLQKVIDIQALRESKQPLDKPNLGSTFKNPEGDFSARLISEAGLKGTRVGGAEISSKHPNFIVNHGDATFEDISKILTLVKEKIKKLYNIQLEEEIIILKNNRVL